MVLESVMTPTMQMALIKAVVVAKAKVKDTKIEQQTVKREKKSEELKQKIVQGLKAARE